MTLPIYELDIENYLLSKGLSINRSVKTGPQIHVIPHGETKAHFAFLPCWCGADDADQGYIEHRAASQADFSLRETTEEC